MAQIIKKTNKKGQVSYLIRVSEGYRADGTQIKHSMTYTPEARMTARQAEKEAQRQAILFEENCANGLYIDQSITLEKFTEMWWNEYATKHLKTKTLQGYEQYLSRIIPAMGHLKIGKITPAHLMKFYNNLAEEGIRKDTKYICTIDLKAAAIKKHKTKQAFSEAAGISLYTLNNAINGQNVTQTSAEKICSALGISLQKAFKANSEKTTLSDKVLLHHHRLLSTIFQTAVMWQVIPSNPCTRVKAPRVEQKEVRCMDDQEMLRFFDCLEKEPLQYKALITLLVYSGMRRGEVCGLQWKDIDFNNKILHIQRTVLYAPKKGIYIDTPKTKGSDRIIKLADIVFTELEQHRKQQAVQRLQLGDRWHNEDFVFTQWDGNPLHPDSLTSWIRKFVRKYDLPYANIHSLRHTNATLLIANGVNVATVSKRLGHSSTATTTKTYIHAIRSADEAAAEVLQNLFQPVPQKQKNTQ